MSKAGWIVKEGGRYKSWKKRWMVIETEALAYYKKEVCFLIYSPFVGAWKTNCFASSQFFHLLEPKLSIPAAHFRWPLEQEGQMW